MTHIPPKNYEDKMKKKSQEENIYILFGPIGPIKYWSSKFAACKGPHYVKSTTNTP